MNLLSVLFSSSAAFLGCFSNSKAAPALKESDICFVYYRTDKATPLKGQQCFFVAREEFEDRGILREKTGLYNDGSFFENYKKIQGYRVFLWRDRVPIARHARENSRVYIVYHSLEKNPPKNGQLCYFIRGGSVYSSSYNIDECYGEYVAPNDPSVKVGHIIQLYPPRPAGRVSYWREAE